MAMEEKNHFKASRVGRAAFVYQIGSGSRKETQLEVCASALMKVTGKKISTGSLPVGSPFFDAGPVNGLSIILPHLCPCADRLAMMNA